MTSGFPSALALPTKPPSVIPLPPHTALLCHVSFQILKDPQSLILKAVPLVFVVSLP